MYGKLARNDKKIDAEMRDVFVAMTLSRGKRALLYA
jgi:hypothetical protein